MLKREDFGFPEDFFRNVVYTHNHNGRFWRRWEPVEDVPYWQLLYRAYEYIERFRHKQKDWVKKKLVGNPQEYNFSVFQSNDSRTPWTRIVWYIQFLSCQINSLLEIPDTTPVWELMERQWRQLVNIQEPVWILGTEIFPDTDFMATLNYQDFPIWFLWFNIERDGNITIKQIQSSPFTDQVRLFFQEWHHFLDGFDWEKVLVTFFEDYLKEAWFSGKIIFQCAENNRYYTPAEDLWEQERDQAKLEERNTRLIKHYNKTAEALWYTRNETFKGFSNREIPNDYSKSL